MFRGSYYNGFAPRDGLPLYPSLWQGCIGAWAPCLGPTGLSLRDWSAYKIHGTLTNMLADSDWIVSSGTYAIDFDGVDDHIVTPSTAITSGLTQWSASMWVRRVGTLAAYASWATMRSSDTSRWQVGCGGAGVGSTSQSALYLGNGSNTFCYSTETPFSDTNWHHIVWCFDGNLTGNARVTGWIDRVAATLTFSGTMPSTLPTNTLPIYFGTQDTSQRFSVIQMDDIRVYNRVLRPNEIALLASRRGIAYDLAPLRMPYSEQVAGGFQAAWALRQRLILGGGGGLG